MDKESRKAFIKGYQEFKNKKTEGYNKKEPTLISLKKNKTNVKKSNVVKCLPRDSRKGI